MGGGEGCTRTKIPAFMALGERANGHFLLIFKVIIASNLEIQSTLFWYVEMLKGETFHSKKYGVLLLNLFE